MNVGYAAIAAVYFELWEKSLQYPDGKSDPAQYRLPAEKALKLLRAFRNVFPIGEPELLYYQGLYEWLTGKGQQAVKTWNRALDAAKRFDMRYEQGLAHIKLGAAVVDDVIAKKEHFEKAIRIFDMMGAVPKSKVAKELANRA